MLPVDFSEVALHLVNQRKEDLTSKLKVESARFVV